MCYLICMCYWNEFKIYWILINIKLIFNRILRSIFSIRIKKHSKQFKKKNTNNIEIFENFLLIKKLLQLHHGFYRIIFVEQTFQYL